MKFELPTRATLALFDQLLPADERVTVLKLFGQPAAYIHGNLFFGVYGNRLFLRLPESECESLIASEGAVRHEPVRARPLPGFVSLAPATLSNRARGVELVRRSLEHAGSLPISGPETRSKEHDRLWWTSGRER